MAVDHPSPPVDGAIGAADTVLPFLVKPLNAAFGSYVEVGSA